MEKMAVLGPRGTHSEAAAFYLTRHLAADRKLVSYPDIYSAIQAVEEGAVSSALIPVENSLEGPINITLDTLARSDTLRVIRELVWPVHNFLMAKPGVTKSSVRRILSHPQPISQCRTLLNQAFAGVEVVEVASTARAAELVAAEDACEGWAAICTERGGELNGLTVLARDIQDNMANATRFFEIVRREVRVPEARKLATKMLVICQIDGAKAGALYDVLREFAERGVNMTRIESRPARTTLGAYIFFFDLELGTDEEALRDALDAVSKKSIWLKELGAFPILEV